MPMGCALYLNDFIWVDMSVASMVWVITLYIREGVLVFEEAELFFGGEFSIDEEEGNFKEGGVLGKLFDGDASVLQYALIAINVADPGGVADSVHIPGVVYSEGFSLVVFQFAHIFGVNEETILAFGHFDFGGFACAIIKQGQLSIFGGVDGIEGEGLAQVVESLHIWILMI